MPDTAEPSGLPQSLKSAGPVTATTPVTLNAIARDREPWRLADPST